MYKRILLRVCICFKLFYLIHDHSLSILKLVYDIAGNFTALQLKVKLLELLRKLLSCEVSCWNKIKISLSDGGLMSILYTEVVGKVSLSMGDLRGAKSRHFLASGRIFEFKGPVNILSHQVGVDYRIGLAAVITTCHDGLNKWGHIWPWGLLLNLWCTKQNSLTHTGLVMYLAWLYKTLPHLLNFLCNYFQ